MDEPQFLQLNPASGSAAAPSPDERPLRRALLQRLFTLLAVSGVAFAFTTWTLVRIEFPFGSSEARSGPARAVEAHLDALNRGQLRAAYNQFSSGYRQKVSFEAYHQLVVTHWRMFRTRELRFSRDDEQGEAAVLETRMVGQDGERYVARFTMVHANGRWWIDDVRWHADRGMKNLLRA